MARPPEGTSSWDCLPTSAIFKNGSVLFSPWSHTGVLTSGSFPQNWPIQPVLLWDLSPRGHQLLLKFSHGPSDLIFLYFLSVNKHWLSICDGLGTELQVRVSSKPSKTHCFAFALPGAHSPGEETVRKPGNHNTQSEGSKPGEYKMIFRTLILGGPLLFSKSCQPLRMARWERLKGCGRRDVLEGRFKSNSVFALPPVCQPLPCLTWGRRLLFLAVSAAWLFSLPNLRCSLLCVRWGLPSHLAVIYQPQLSCPEELALALKPASWLGFSTAPLRIPFDITCAAGAVDENAKGAGWDWRLCEG